MCVYVCVIRKKKELGNWGMMRKRGRERKMRGGERDREESGIEQKAITKKYIFI